MRFHKAFWGAILLTGMLSLSGAQTQGISEKRAHEFRFTVPAKGDPVFRFPAGTKPDIATLTVQDAKKRTSLTRIEQGDPKKGTYRVIGSSAILFSPSDRRRSLILRVEARSLRVAVLPVINQSGLDYLGDLAYQAIVSSLQKRGFEVVSSFEAEQFLREREILPNSLFTEEPTRKTAVLTELAQALNLAYIVQATVTGWEEQRTEQQTVVSETKKEKGSEVRIEQSELVTKYPSAQLTVQVWNSSGQSIAQESAGGMRQAGFRSFRSAREQILRGASEQIFRTLWGD